MNIRLTILILLTLCTSSSIGQRLGVDMLKSSGSVTIPFKLKNGFIVINAKFGNTLPLKFIFDTGADHTILFHKAYTDLLGIQYSSKVQIKGSDLNDNQYALIARNINLQLEDQRSVIRDVLVLEESMLLFKESFGFDIDGIIGGSFFRGLVVEIDYKHSKLVLYHPDSFKMKRKGYTKFDITVEHNKPYIYTQSILNPSDTLRTKLLIDTGASIPFLLHANSDSSIVIPPHLISGTIGHGISGDLIGFIGKTHGLNIGPYSFTNILTLFQDLSLVEEDATPILRNGILGNSLLSRFSVFINYLKEELYLKPDKNYNKSFDYDRSGLVIFAFGEDLNEFYVRDVFAKSPAAEAGILPGDIITKIGMWKSSNYTLDRIVKLLQKKEGKKIKMKINRNGVEMKFEFRLRDLFEESSPQ